MVTVIGVLILVKVNLDWYLIKELNKTRNPKEIDYDWLLFYLDFIFCLIGL